MNRRTRFIVGVILGGALFGSAAGMEGNGTFELPENIDDFEFTEAFAAGFLAERTADVDEFLKEKNERLEAITLLTGFVCWMCKQSGSRNHDGEKVQLEDLSPAELCKVAQATFQENGTTQKTLSEQLKDGEQLIDQLKKQLTDSVQELATSKKKSKKEVDGLKKFVQGLAGELARLKKQLKKGL